MTKKEKGESLFFYVVCFFTLIGLGTWFVIGCWIFGEITPFTYIYGEGYASTFNPDALAGFAVWLATTILLISLVIVSWWNAEEEGKGSPVQ